MQKLSTYLSKSMSSISLLLASVPLSKGHSVRVPPKHFYVLLACTPVHTLQGPHVPLLCSPTDLAHQSWHIQQESIQTSCTSHSATRLMKTLLKLVPFPHIFLWIVPPNLPHLARSPFKVAVQLINDCCTGVRGRKPHTLAWGQTADLTSKLIHQQKPLRELSRESDLNFSMTIVLVSRLRTAIWTDPA